MCVVDLPYKKESHVVLLIQLMGTENKSKGTFTSSYHLCSEILFWKGVLGTALHFQVTIAIWWFVLATAGYDMN